MYKTYVVNRNSDRASTLIGVCSVGWSTGNNLCILSKYSVKSSCTCCQLSIFKIFGFNWKKAGKRWFRGHRYTVLH